MFSRIPSPSCSAHGLRSPARGAPCSASRLPSCSPPSSDGNGRASGIPPDFDLHAHSLAGCAAALLDQSLLDANIPLLSAAAIIGMAILSCNSILFSSKNQIKGLTTSAALWACGLVGVALGSGAYVLALAAFAALLLTVSWFPRLEKYLKDRSNHFEVHLELTAKDTLQDFVSTIRALGIRIDDIEANPAYLGSGLSVFSVSFTITSPELKQYKKHAEIIEALQSLEYVHYIEEMN